jgi:hypothetical protein
MRGSAQEVKEALPVKIVQTPEELTSLAVEFGSTSTFPVNQISVGPPTQLLNRRPTRLKAIISIDTLSNGATSVILASRADFLANPNNPQGFTIGAVPKIFLWENQQPLYAVAVGGGPVLISVIDQAQAAAGSGSEEYNQAAGMTVESEEEGGRYAGTDAGNQY